MNKLVVGLCWLLVCSSVFARSNTERHPIERPVIKSRISTITGDPSLRSMKGQEIQVIRIPARNQKGRVTATKYHFYIQGGLHGDETETTHFVEWLAQRVQQGQSKLNQLPEDQVAFDFVPIANPDGVSSLSRYNQAGINLNRNFGHLWGISRENPGSAPFSEPETRAVKSMLDKHRYTAAVDVHGYINWIVAPSKPNPNALPSEVHAYKQWVTILNSEMGRFDPTYKLKTAKELGDGGAFEDYAYWQSGTKAFCLEMATAFRHIYQTRDGALVKIDSYESYENLIYHVFKRALELEDSGIKISQN